MTLHEHLHHTFPALMLRPPLFDSWDIGIRFESNPFMSKQTIFHIYDDRGCDLLATSLDTIRGIYESYSHWSYGNTFPADR